MLEARLAGAAGDVAAVRRWLAGRRPAAAGSESVGGDVSGDEGRGVETEEADVSAALEVSHSLSSAPSLPLSLSPSVTLPLPHLLVYVLHLCEARKHT